MQRQRTKRNINDVYAHMLSGSKYKQTHGRVDKQDVRANWCTCTENIIDFHASAKERRSDGDTNGVRREGIQQFEIESLGNRMNGKMK